MYYLTYFIFSLIDDDILVVIRIYFIWVLLFCIFEFILVISSLASS